MKFPQTDAELWAYVRGRVDARPAVSMAKIAEELGVGVDDLCAWVMAYSAPKRDKTALNRRGSLPALVSDNMVSTHWPASHNAQRFANWRRATAAAHKARVGD